MMGLLLFKQGDPGVRGPTGNPGKEGPKVHIKKSVLSKNELFTKFVSRRIKLLLN